MNDVSTPMMNLLEKALDVTSQRHKLVIANMANIDTPGYHAKDLDFRSELKRAASAGGDDTFLPVARSVPGLLERPDGNNVSLDREGLLLAETQMQFGLGIQLLQHEFHNLLSAINEGGKV
ncbi:MAG: flagellar biosynthesis protein FlgB [Terriglobales bacterium]|jgi:flagellar basal-body rod protein FlgB